MLSRLLFYFLGRVLKIKGYVMSLNDMFNAIDMLRNCTSRFMLDFEAGKLAAYVDADVITFSNLKEVQLWIQSN
jgi:hypothetical protein